MFVSLFCFDVFGERGANQHTLHALACILFLVVTFIHMYVVFEGCVAAPVSGWMLNAGTVESLCMKPYVTLPLEPSSASTAWTCRTNVPAGWSSRTEVLSRYCWHWPTKDYCHVNRPRFQKKSCDNPLIPLDIQFKQTQPKDVHYCVSLTL